MTDTVVSSGITSSGYGVTSGNELEVANGGSATLTTVSAGGLLQVDAGGSDSGATIYAGGSALILGNSGGIGGTATNDTIYGTMTISGALAGNAGTATTAVVSNETVNSGGILQLLATGATANNTVVNAGSVYVSKSGILSGITIENGGSVVLNSNKAVINGGITFSGTGNTLAISTINASSAGDQAIITGFSTGDALDVGPVLSNGSITSAAGNNGTEVYTLSGTSGGAAVSESFIFDSAGYNLTTQADTKFGGTDIVLAPVCFAENTLIRTTLGEVLVEQLKVGDLVVTRDGRQAPIRWMGHRKTRCNLHPEPTKVWPVRVCAGTFGPGKPAADLWLSPGHSLCLADALVPVRGLIDGEQIVQVQQDMVTYWHVELDRHDVLLANGLPAESYLDTGNRCGFENGDVTALHFEEARSPNWDGTGYCLPLVESGPKLSAIRTLYGLGQRGAFVDCDQDQDSVQLIVSDSVIRPIFASENELRFLLPASSGEARLVSPSRAAEGADIRRLGVIVSAIAASDGSCWNAVALDDPGLIAGFHDVERGSSADWRWTNGEAHLAASLWARFAGPVMLRLIGQFTGFKSAEPDEVFFGDERSAASNAADTLNQKAAGNPCRRCR